MKRIKEKKPGATKPRMAKALAICLSMALVSGAAPVSAIAAEGGTMAEAVQEISTEEEAGAMGEVASTDAAIEEDGAQTAKDEAMPEDGEAPAESTTEESPLEDPAPEEDTESVEVQPQAQDAEGAFGSGQESESTDESLPNEQADPFAEADAPAEDGPIDTDGSGWAQDEGAAMPAGNDAAPAWDEPEKEDPEQETIDTEYTDVQETNDAVEGESGSWQGEGEPDITQEEGTAGSVWEGPEDGILAEGEDAQQTPVGDGNSALLSAKLETHAKQITPAVELSQTSFAYNGSEQKPAVTVRDGDTVIPEDDYTVAYSSGSVDKGTYTVDVVMTGEEYAGEGSASYTITAKAVDPDVMLSQNRFTYNGRAQRPAVTVRDGDTVLPRSAYTASLPKESINAGARQIKVTLRGNYAGEKTVTYRIDPKKTTPSVALSTLKYTYDGKTHKPRATVRDGSTKLTGADYTVEYPKDLINAGTRKVTVTLRGNYTGKKAVTYRILPRKVPFTVSLSSTSYVCDGKAKKPSVTVRAGGKKLSPGEYDVVRSTGAQNVGTHSVSVRLKGNYAGEKAASFRINPKGTSIKKVTGGKSWMMVRWDRQPSQIRGYQLQYSRDRHFESGNRTFTVAGPAAASQAVKKPAAGKQYYVRVRTYKKVGNRTYYSSWSSAVRTDLKYIKPGVALSGTTFPYNGKVQKPAITVKDGDTVLPASSYTVAWPDSPRDVGTYKVTVTLRGGYRGTKTATYRILPKEAEPQVTLTGYTYVYNGEVRTPGVAVKAGTDKLPEKEYTVTFDKGRRDVGEYKATVKLKGNYAGTKSASFRILPKGTSIKSASKKSGILSIRIGEQADQTTGYQVEYCMDKSFAPRKSETVFFPDTSWTSIDIPDPLPGGSRYVRVRTYKEVGSSTYCSSWSGAVPVQAMQDETGTEPDTPEEPEHAHTWEDVTKKIHHKATGHYEKKQTGTVTVVDEDEWDEYVYIYGCRCTVCGYTEYGPGSGRALDIHGALVHVVNGEFASYSSVRKRTGEIIHHPAVTHEEPVYEDVWVEDTAAWDETVVTGQRCTGCGATR